MDATPAAALRSIAEIIRRHGAKCPAADFHAAVNVTFHKIEPAVYDQERADLWTSLPQQLGLLVDNVFRTTPDPGRQFRLLDIGSGTELATQCTLNTQVKGRISGITLLTSPAMLRQASRKAEGWKIFFDACQGLLDNLRAGEKYDLIITCSVLHHIPDLDGFLANVRRHHADRGVFLHLQDPHGDDSRDPKPNLAQRALGRLFRKLTGKHADNYLINKALMQNGVIETPLTPVEIYSITDIHMEKGEGILVHRMKASMSDYDCLLKRADGFFARLWSDLASRQALNDLQIGAVWMLR